ncbi:hypothetical protein EVAR_78401_1 [Eumeta japonica]|uniref:Uncharacterized protein n=1 Tax=Eumeta variegata TaxID=151549 RepID=A0A4C1T653_EUMVA|nr:hypothetical protein EVAR_78401_1 [Eumeta japonica]
MVSSPPPARARPPAAGGGVPTTPGPRLARPALTSYQFSGTRLRTNAETLLTNVTPNGSRYVPVFRSSLMNLHVGNHKPKTKSCDVENCSFA